MREEAREIVRLARRIDELNQRLARTMLTGEVVKVEGDKVRLRLRDKDQSTGKEFLSPLIRWQGHAGSESGGFSMTTRPAVGEKMRLFSPSGEIGPGSLAVPDSFSNAAPNPDQGADFMIRMGETHLSIGAGGIRLFVGGVGIEINAEIITHGTTRLDNGNRQVHFKGGVDSRGDQAVDGAERVFV
jgi:hypothetical protein